MPKQTQHVKIGYEENWFKRHPGWTALFIIMLIPFLMGIYQGITGTSSANTDTPDQDKIQQPDSNEQEQAKTHQIGDTVQVGNIAYRINDVSTAEVVSMGSYLSEEADGIFYIIDLTVENKGKESGYLFGSTLTVIDDQGREFDHDSEAEMYHEESISFGEQIQPGLAKSGVKIFDLPKNAKGLELKIVGSGLSAEEAYFDLGM